VSETDVNTRFNAKEHTMRTEDPSHPLADDDDLLPEGWTDWQQDQDDDEPNVLRGTD
jgi:hypothetical protein